MSCVGFSLPERLRMDVANFTNEGTSDLTSRFTHDMQNLVVGLNALFGKLLREPLKMVTCLVLAAMVSWQLLILSLVVAPVAGLVIRSLAKMLKRANRKAMEEMAQLYTVLGETFQGIKIVKAFTMERQERRRFHAISKKYFEKSMKIGWYDAWTRPMTEVLGIMIICLAMLSGAYLVLRGQTHLLGMADDRATAELADAAVVLRPVDRNGRSGKKTFGRVHPTSMRGRRCRPDLRPVGPAAAGPRSRKSAVPAASLQGLGSRKRVVRLSARAPRAPRDQFADPFWGDDRHCRA